VSISASLVESAVLGFFDPSGPDHIGNVHDGTWCDRRSSALNVRRAFGRVKMQATV
jgi:hypothetical protein